MVARGGDRARTVTTVTDGSVVAVAVVAVVVGANRRRGRSALVLALVVGAASRTAVARSPRCCWWSCCSPSAARCGRSTSGPGSLPTRLGPYEGWVRLIDDPAAVCVEHAGDRRGRGRAVRAVVAWTSPTAADPVVAWRRMGDGQR